MTPPPLGGTCIDLVFIRYMEEYPEMFEPSKMVTEINFLNFFSNLATDKEINFGRLSLPMCGIVMNIFFYYF